MSKKTLLQTALQNLAASASATAHAAKLVADLAQEAGTQPQRLSEKAPGEPWWEGNFIVSRKDNINRHVAWGMNQVPLGSGGDKLTASWWYESYDENVHIHGSAPKAWNPNANKPVQDLIADAVVAWKKWMDELHRSHPMPGPQVLNLKLEKPDGSKVPMTEQWSP